MAPSVSVLTGFDCLDFQDSARGRGGGVGGAWPTTVMPYHFQLRSLTGLYIMLDNRSNSFPDVAA